MSDPDNLPTIAEVVRRLMALSHEFPEETLYITIHDGHCTVGIPKGAQGDRINERLGDLQDSAVLVHGDRN